MLRKFLLISGAVFIFAGLSVFGQEKTVVKSMKARRALMGKHKLSLQWISWDYFGRVIATQKKGVVILKGEQRGRRTKDFLTIEGVVTEINEKDFKFSGKIITQVSFINGGKPCIREGLMTFRITGKRKYWRLEEINNPCDEVADYVDIFLR